MFFIDFIEIFQSKMKSVHVNKGFYLIILEKIVDPMLNYSQLSSRLYTMMMTFFTLQSEGSILSNLVRNREISLKIHPKIFPI